MENAKRSVETSGKTVEDAIQRGLMQLGLERSQVQIEVISEGRAGILGFGAEPARVRLTQAIAANSAPAWAPPSQPDTTTPAEYTQPPSTLGHAPATPADKPDMTVSREAHGQVDTPSVPVTAAQAAMQATTTQPATPTVAARSSVTEKTSGTASSEGATSSEATAIATETVQHLVSAMGYEAKVDARIVSNTESGETGDSLFVDITGRNLNNLIGQDGETLGALQFITRLIVNHKTQQWTEIVVDVDNHRQRRVDELNSLAARAADRVVRDGRPVSLQAMPANERRIIHLALRNHPNVMTVSIGQGDNRKVTIRQKP
ncbi:MAG: protein jag [Chloroflexi bacterium]|nr:protein jag [Chloroflexota bacterium]